MFTVWEVYFIMWYNWLLMSFGMWWNILGPEVRGCIPDTTVALPSCGAKHVECYTISFCDRYVRYANNRTDNTSGIQPQYALGLWVFYILVVPAVVFWKVPLYPIFWVEDLPLKLLVELNGPMEADMKSLWILQLLLNSTLLWCWHSKHTSSYARIDFFPWIGWGSEQAPWSTTSSGGDVKPIIDPGLRNQWLLYYIIIDGARKCHGRSTTYYLLCWIVSLICVRLLCSALMFPYHVYLYYEQLAFIFLLWFHLGKWILVLFRGCKGNKFF